MVHACISFVQCNAALIMIYEVGVMVNTCISMVQCNAALIIYAVGVMGNACISFDGAMQCGTNHDVVILALTLIVARR